MRVRHIKITIVFGIIALCGVILIQGYWLTSTYKMHSESFDQNLWLALKDIAINVNQLHNCKPNDLNPVSQINQTCFIVDVGCDYSRVNLEYAIKTTFNRLHLNVGYSLWYYNCNIGKLEPMGNYNSQGDLINIDNLFPDCQNVYNNDLVYYFTINVTGRADYLSQKMHLWFLLSFLVLIIVVFFTYTIFAFFNQKRLTEMQKDFINNMTHEFKTPISSINIASDVILNQSVNIEPRILKYAGLIKQENLRLNNLVEKVLRTARVEKRQTIISKSILNLNLLLADIITDTITQSFGNNTQINLLPNAATDTILADKLHLTNLIFNLIDNAVKYNINNPVINIYTYNIKKNIVLKISDNGIGIKPEYRKKIFTKFFRIPTGNVHDVKGFGLGLFYVKQVCSQHNWHVKVDSQPNKGTVFYIKIPIKKINT